MENDDAFDDKVIEIRPRKRRIWLFVLIAIVLFLFLLGSPLIGIYVDALWFSSLGFSDAYWYKFRLGGLLFVIFLVLTFLILRLSFAALTRWLPQLRERPQIRLRSVEDVRDVNILSFVYRPVVWLVSLGAALLYAISMSSDWSAFALYLNASPAGSADPIFRQDASFYLFKLPALEIVANWFFTLTVIIFLSVLAISAYVSYYERSIGLVVDDTRNRVVAIISAAGILLAIAMAWNTYLSRFDLLHTPHDLFTGVSYTDAHVLLPGMNVLMIVLIAAAVVLAANAFFFKSKRIIGWTAAAAVIVWLVAVVILPKSIYSLSVKPNELAKETPYIQHNIEMTRRAFDLERFEEKPFIPQPTLTARHVEENQETIGNIRLWDPQVLQSTFKQIQEIRQYYEFRVPDIDRYVLNGKLRQVMLAAREMNVDKLEATSRNWINQHLVYTHGYGVAMSSVNEFTPEGLPHLIVKDMPVTSEAPEIQIKRPEIYFGEVTNHHAYVRTNQPEFNYSAQGDQDSYTEYEGAAGIPIGGMLRKTALAFYLGDNTSLLFSDYITSESRVLIRRNVLERARQIAPFLMYETDPYIVISKDGRLFWMIDAFTHSDRYPYSRGYQVAGRSMNYIRNSVKVVIDAYEGKASFYVFEPDDPIIKSYQRIFPSLFRPAEEMPEDLRAHVRYPDLLAEAQAVAYTLYHITNPQTFYNREDMWAIASVEVSTQQGAQAVPMQPYYVLMQLPGFEKRLEFVSILPFTPAGPGRNNMIGWMAARSDKETYGETLLFTFPKSLTVNGPAQIRARVNQDRELSQLMTLWSQRGSELVRSNLLVIPIGDSLLYVESFYLQAEGSGSKLPELRQVAVATQNRLATGNTFEEALRKLMADTPTQQPAETVAQTAPPARPPGGAPSPTPAAPAQPAAGDLGGLARQAQQLLSDYERLSAEGRHREAGEKLDQLKQTITEMNRRRTQ
ncbi:MAG TPA: UPF0182 family protein [Blastocatellia bacterium]|nr:UPF0182 family protein [Blastocatellia bacterium]